MSVFLWRAAEYHFVLKVGNGPAGSNISCCDDDISIRKAQASYQALHQFSKFFDCFEKFHDFPVIACRSMFVRGDTLVIANAWVRTIAQQ